MGGLVLSVIQCPSKRFLPVGVFAVEQNAAIVASVIAASMVKRFIAHVVSVVVVCPVWFRAMAIVAPRVFVLEHLRGMLG